MSIHNKNYDTDVKRKWREMVWSYWRQLSGQTVLSKDLQYWTLPDKILDDNHEPFGELKHIKEFGLIESDRSFIGVCNEKTKALRNLPCCQQCDVHPEDHDSGDCLNYSSGYQWAALYGDIANLVGEFNKHKKFHPGIINLDSINGKDLGWKLAARVGQYCVGHPGTVMILNLVKKYRCINNDTVEILDEKDRYRCFRSATLYNPEIEYQGSAVCTMMTVFLVW
jgi:hypothetical protein